MCPPAPFVRNSFVYRQLRGACIAQKRAPYVPPTCPPSSTSKTYCLPASKILFDGIKDTV